MHCQHQMLVQCDGINVAVLDWANLPRLALVAIFTFLSRRDRLASTMVCLSWKSAMQTASLWYSFRVFIDSDLSEPSTMMLMRYYHHYIRRLYLDWKHPDIPQRWIPVRMQEITKRVCRFLMIMMLNRVQLHSITFHRFYERYRLKKVTYYLSMFIKTQKHLKNVDFTRALFIKNNFLRHFLSLENSFKSITHIHILDSYFGNGVLPQEFANGFIQLRNLISLRIDYITFCGDLVDCIIKYETLQRLKYLEMHFYDDDNGDALTEDMWRRFTMACPKVKVALYFNDISHISRLKNKLHAGIPLMTCSINCYKNLDEFFFDEYSSRDLIMFITKHYADTLEHFKLRLKDNHTVVDGLLLELAMRCTKLETLEFFGIVQNLEIIQEIFSRKYKDFKSFSLATENVSHKNLQVLFRMFDDLNQKKDCALDFKMYNKNLENYVTFYG